MLASSSCPWSALVNLRGVAESVKANIVLTCVELSGLLIVIFVGVFAVTQGKADFSRVVMFDTPEDKSIFIAVTAGTSLAFFAMVGFEDSVNMAEETKDPEKVFPKIMLTGLGITGLIYILVSITAIALVPAGELGEGEAPLTKVVAAGAPNLPIGDIFPLIAMFAVANSALINMLMASRLLYGMAKQRVLPPALGRVLDGTAYAVGRDPVHHRPRRRPADHSCVGQAGSSSACSAARRRCCCSAVFTVVNICCLVLRRDPIERKHFRAPDRAADHRRAVLRLPGRAVDRPRHRSVHDRRHPDRHRHRALVRHLVDQPGRYARKTYLKDPEALTEPD